MGLTPEDIIALQKPLPFEDHEVRAKGKNKDESKVQYLLYINQEGIIPLLSRIDANWSWDVLSVNIGDRYVSVTGRLTIKGVSRDGVGGNSPNGKSNPVDEDTVKGAETDALKRAALRFGVGLYLRSSPAVWVPVVPNKPWEEVPVARKEYSNWYQREFGGKQSKPNPAPQPAPVPPLAEVVRPKAEPAASSSGNGDTARAASASTPSTVVIGADGSIPFDEMFAPDTVNVVTPDALYAKTAALFNAKARFTNWWNQHVDELKKKTLEEAERWTRAMRWNWDKQQAQTFAENVFEKFNAQTKDILEALTTANGKKVGAWRDWDGGTLSAAYGAMLAWYADYDQARLAGMENSGQFDYSEGAWANAAHYIAVKQKGVA